MRAFDAAMAKIVVDAARELFDAFELVARLSALRTTRFSVSYGILTSAFEDGGGAVVVLPAENTDGHVAPFEKCPVSASGTTMSCFAARVQHPNPRIRAYVCAASHCRSQPGYGGR